MSWLLLQLADSAFPTGGFAHSSGLEAAVKLGLVNDETTLARFVDDVMVATRLGALPLVNAAHADPKILPRLDATCDAFLANTITKRASFTQGRAFAATTAEIFEATRFVQESIQKREIVGHHAPVYGAILRTLDVAEVDASRLFLHLTLRGVLSAAVRLGVIGPHRAQRWHHEREPLLDRLVTESSDLTLSDLAHSAPIAEMFASHHDTLYSRLFQS